MRTPRSIQLAEPEGVVHKLWRCHNREFNLGPDANKALYLQCTVTALKKDVIKDHVTLRCYCVMDNHAHETIAYQESSAHLSNFMRQSHSRFGRRLNDRLGRSGKVAEDRPKTPLIQDDEHEMLAQFYIESNAIRDKKIPLEKLKNYKYCSYRYYAFGIVDEFTKHITPPQWYLNLGKTNKDRQRAYRRLFVQYLKAKGIEPHGFLQAFIGSPIWCEAQKEKVKQRLTERVQSKLLLCNSS